MQLPGRGRWSADNVSAYDADLTRCYSVCLQHRADARGAVIIDSKLIKFTVGVRLGLALRRITSVMPVGRLWLSTSPHWAHPATADSRSTIIVHELLPPVSELPILSGRSWWLSVGQNDVVPT